jgi:hypothetical protein
MNAPVTRLFKRIFEGKTNLPCDRSSVHEQLLVTCVDQFLSKEGWIIRRSAVSKADLHYHYSCWRGKRAMLKNPLRISS